MPATNSALQRARATMQQHLPSRRSEWPVREPTALAEGDWRLVPTAANRMPTAASYLRRHGDSQFRAFKFDVLRIEDAKIAEITTFGAELFAVFGLPSTISSD